MIKNKKNRNFTLAVIATVLLVAGLIGYISYQSEVNDSNKNVPLAKAIMKHTPRALTESRPVLSGTMWSGPAKRAYEIAASIPEVIDAQYCYCNCVKNPNFMHKTLLTCFTESHGAHCGICQNEVLMSEMLYKKGLSISEIRREVDKTFGKNKGS